jgi:hypothetical protein
VVDGRTVSAEDLGSNFFVTQAHIGQPRAQVTAEMLQELNEDVDASKFVSEDPAQLISRSPEFFDSFTAVVVTQLADAPLQALGARCDRKPVASRSQPLDAVACCCRHPPGEASATNPQPFDVRHRVAAAGKRVSRSS